jgi:signal transduction histidine kinase
LGVERLRRKISSDLHDDIGSTLSSINIYSELAKHEEDNKPYIETIQQHTKSIINNLDDLVWSINPRNDTISILADRMRAFAEPFLAAKNIACDFVVDIPDEESTLSLDRRQHVYLLFKEMVNNVVKHSQCSYCRIQFIQKGKHVYLSVRDNGRGFNVTNNHTSRNGLHNLNERTRQLKGHLLVESSPGKGTELQLDMQL